MVGGMPDLRYPHNRVDEALDVLSFGLAQTVGTRESPIVRSSVNDGIVAHTLCTQLRGTTARLWFIFRLWLEDP